MTSVPDRLLICCEGKTEALYFDIIAGVYDVYNIVDIEGEQGEGKQLVDNCVKLRKEIKQKYSQTKMVEAWVVCDDDKRDISYLELEKYAVANGVKLAYIKPQFEAFILQHFEQSKEHRRSVIFQRLRRYLPNYSKGCLGELEDKILDKPSLVDTAIINCRQRNNRTKKNFITVHKLVERLRDIGELYW